MSINKGCVVIPAYNEEKVIGDTIEKFLSQNKRECFEIVVVDNNSSDNTGNIAKEILGADNVVLERRKGLVNARRAGVEYVKENFSDINVIIQTDADTFPKTNNFIKTHLEQYKDQDIIGVGGEISFLDRKITVELYWLLYNLFKGKLGQNYYEKRQHYIDQGIIPAPGANMSYRINALDGFEGLRGQAFAEDFYRATKIQKHFSDKVFKLIDSSSKYGDDIVVLTSARDDNLKRILQNKANDLKRILETGYNDNNFSFNNKR